MGLKAIFVPDCAASLVGLERKLGPSGRLDEGFGLDRIAPSQTSRRLRTGLVGAMEESIWIEKCVHSDDTAPLASFCRGKEGAGVNKILHAWTARLLRGGRLGQR